MYNLLSQFIFFFPPRPRFALVDFSHFVVVDFLAFCCAFFFILMYVRFFRVGYSFFFVNPFTVRCRRMLDCNLTSLESR